MVNTDASWLCMKNEAYAPWHKPVLGYYLSLIHISPKCSYITPVPGGVGPMTIISLMRNTLLAGKKEIYK